MDSKQDIKVHTHTHSQSGVCWRSTKGGIVFMTVLLEHFLTAYLHSCHISDLSVTHSSFSHGVGGGVMWEEPVTPFGRNVCWAANFVAAHTEGFKWGRVSEFHVLEESSCTLYMSLVFMPFCKAVIVSHLAPPLSHGQVLAVSHDLSAPFNSWFRPNWCQTLSLEQQNGTLGEKLTIDLSCKSIV